MKYEHITMYQLKIKEINGQLKVLDPVRRKYVSLTPEEKVRQYFIAYLHNELNYPFSLMMVEKKVFINGMDKRFDIACADKTGRLRILIECKAEGVNISQKVFDQLSVYNISSKVDYLVITNGKSTYACQMDYKESSFNFIQDIPNYHMLNT